MTISLKAVAAVFTGVGAIVGGIHYHLQSKKCRQEENVVVLRCRDDSSRWHNTAERGDALSSLTDVAKVSTGQADGVIIDIVNARRIDRLMRKLATIDHNRAGAEKEIRQLKTEIKKLLSSNRGSGKGVHGFIGETAQVHVSNIKAFINGDEPLYILLDDNSMTDYTRGMQIIQQKACLSDGYMGLTHIRRHKVMYPEFLKKDGIYQIPKDMYDKYIRLRDLPESVALKLRREELRQWKFIRTFTNENSDVRIEPMELTYSDIQSGNIQTTLKRIERDAHRNFKRQYAEAKKEHAPSAKECAKICGISAVIEGAVSGASEILFKLKGGKKLHDFNKQDLKDIAASTILGSGKGAIRGSAVYLATNYLKVSSAIATGAVTAVYSIISKWYSYWHQESTKEEFFKESVFAVLETMISTCGAVAGRRICKKYPVIGAIAGSILGSTGVRFIQQTAF